MNQGLRELADIAIEAAINASREIITIYHRSFHQEIKEDGSPVTEADLASSKIIQSILDISSIPIIGEELENSSYDERSNWVQTWIVDPLDGTKEFIKRNDEFAINIALVENGKPIFGLIASPTEEHILIGGKDLGVFFFSFDNAGQSKNWIEVQPAKLNSPIIMAGSRSHHSGSVLKYINELKTIFQDIEFIKKGSALKFIDLALGKADVYPRFAPTMEWDIAAGQAIMEALGGTVIHAESGDPLTYNKANLYNPYFIAKSKAFLEYA